MTDFFVHIGAPKTGTTAIQKYLTRHRAALRDAGTLYPEGGVLLDAHHLIGAAIFPERVRRLRGAGRDEVLATSAAAIRAEMDAAQPKRVIVSSEYLWGELSAANVRRLLDPFADCTLHVVAYLRRQDLLAQSLYMQAVKGGGARSFPRWMEDEGEGARAGMHFDRVLRSWRDCGLPVRLVLRIYESGQVDEDVCRDFLDVVCPDIPFSASDNRGVNTAADLLTIELLRRINAEIDDAGVSNTLRRRILGRTPPRATFAPISYLSGSDAAAFMARFAAGNEWIARELMGRDDGILFRQPLPDTDTVASDATDAAMLDRLIALLPQLSPAALPKVPAPAPAPKPGPSAAKLEARRKRRAERATAEG